jgi:hypothetical protein
MVGASKANRAWAIRHACFAIAGLAISASLCRAQEMPRTRAATAPHMSVVGFGERRTRYHDLGAPQPPDFLQVTEVTDNELVNARINQTTFHIPKKYVGFYDKKDHGILTMYFLLPKVVPVRQFSHFAATQALFFSILAATTSTGPYLDRLKAEGKLRTTPYGFGLQQLPPGLVIGAPQYGPPDVRNFMGYAGGHRVLILCVGLRHAHLLPPRCHYTFVVDKKYSLQLDIPLSYLPQWKSILTKILSYTASHEVK